MPVLQDLMTSAQQRAQSLQVDAQTQPVSHPSFAQALRGKEKIQVIAEFKRRSPSENAIAPQCQVTAQVQTYAQAGAAALSVLTEPSRFQGSYADLQEARDAVSLPILMKDFVVDERQVQHAASIGASAILLIVRCLQATQLHDLSRTAQELGLDVLVECHNEAELETALQIPSAIIGINNRDLDSLAIDIQRGQELLLRVPEQRIAVAESGYTSPDMVHPLQGLADAVLIGSALMRAAEPKDFIQKLQTGACKPK